MLMCRNLLFVKTQSNDWIAMMHHPNMHHQPMSGHPPQHLAGHQAMPGHHQMPPHQMHRENRVPLGPSGAHGQSLGGLGALGVHQHQHHAAPRAQHAPHAIRAMPHHPPAQHHAMPPQQMKAMRRPYSVGGGYGPAGGVMPPPFAPHHQHQPPPAAQPTHTVVAAPSANANLAARGSSPGREAGGEECGVKPVDGGEGGEAPAEAPAPAAPAAPAPPPAAPPQANSKEKTPMCLVNELARYNKIKHQYRLTSETGPAHKKVFTVTLRLGDTEEYTAEGSSIKRAQHAAASAALSGTAFPPPPPRAPPAHAPHAAHHRHAGAVMPTVELNALAMKLCQPAVYTSVPAVGAAPRARARLPPPYRLPHPALPAHPPPLVPPPYPRMFGPGLVYRVRVCVGGRAWLGEGSTPQAARHDAAARALQDLRPHHPDPEPDTDTGGDTSTDLLNSEVKSPVSLVHELALKRNLSVQFTVKSERGPPHMRVFVTACTVGEMETEGEGNGKKVSKRRAAERMLEEMRRRWPPALLRARPPHDRRRHQPAKKKPRNLIKEGGFGCPGGGGAGGGATGGGGADNPISRLAVARHAARARSPQYRVLEERGAARRREFLVQCDAPPHCATGLGPNKKTAKRRAAHNVLLAMEMSASGTDPSAATAPSSETSNTNGTTEGNKTNNSNDSKRKDNEAVTGGGANIEVRQPVPGVLMMDYHQRSGQPQQHSTNGVSETSATGGSGGNTPGAKDQLMYLSQLLGFTVQFSDFPKRNHGEYLSLVSLSTEPPVMCHGGGASTAHSHEQCARAALRALALMGLEPSDSAAPGMQNMPGSGAKTGVISNGISE
ncbi:unnamed protein product [Parnassius apollo]|uniref:(apollo) hypothetical protein n=1 Tax=Parnassius apollo TaxID=110799 RepID=A0A8S3XPD6_PARAO|nr:unnamed protein product [Parnassius apollo]